MKLICPGCGATNSAESMSNDEAARKTLAVICQLQPPLPVIVLPYLSLFRPEKSALSWAKALRLAQDLAVLVGKGHVQIDKKPARRCPASVWAQAMDEMLGRRDKLTRPMPNHNYLRDVAYTIAEREDAATEKRIVESERNGGFRTSSFDAGKPEAATDWASIPENEWLMLPKPIREKHQHERKQP